MNHFSSFVLLFCLIFGCSSDPQPAEQSPLPVFDARAFRNFEFELHGTTKSAVGYQCHTSDPLTIQAEFTCTDRKTLVESGSIQLLKEKDPTHRVIVDSWSFTAKSVSGTNKQVTEKIRAPKDPGDYTLLIQFVGGLILCNDRLTVLAK